MFFCFLYIYLNAGSHSLSTDTECRQSSGIVSFPSEVSCVQGPAFFAFKQEPAEKITSVAVILFCHLCGEHEACHVKFQDTCFIPPPLPHNMCVSYGYGWMDA